MAARDIHIHALFDQRIDDFHLALSSSQVQTTSPMDIYAAEVQTLLSSSIIEHLVETKGARDEEWRGWRANAGLESLLVSILACAAPCS